MTASEDNPRRTFILAGAFVVMVSVFATCRLIPPPASIVQMPSTAAIAPPAMGRQEKALVRSLSFLRSPCRSHTLAEKYGDHDLVEQVQQAINGGRTIRAHGEKDMLVWGEFFAEELKGSRIASRPNFPKVLDLAKYVATQMQGQTGASAEEKGK